MLAVIHGILQVLLWLLIAVAGLLALVILLCCLPVGVAASNLRGETWAWLKIGFLRIRLTPKKPLTEKQQAKKERKKKRKAEKKARKKKKKQIAGARKKTAASASTGKHAGKSKPPKPKDTGMMVRALLASLADYDDEYLKLLCIQRLNLTLIVGGGSPEGTGKRFGKAAEIFGWIYPIMMRRMHIKHHQIAVRPDFVTNRTVCFYDLVVTVRPICVLKSAVVFWFAFRRNCRIYRTPKQEQTISMNNRSTSAEQTAESTT